MELFTLFQKLETSKGIYEEFPKRDETHTVWITMEIRAQTSGGALNKSETESFCCLCWLV